MTAQEAVARAIDQSLTYQVERDTLACDLTPDELSNLAQAAITAYLAHLGTSEEEIREFVRVERLTP